MGCCFCLYENILIKYTFYKRLEQIKSYNERIKILENIKTDMNINISDLDILIFQQEVKINKKKNNIKEIINNNLDSSSSDLSDIEDIFQNNSTNSSSDDSSD
jgi:2C-methyl-D-erythritol 2,4-cyclodiphosphate synthase